MKELMLIILPLILGCNCAGETSTHPPVNRGAARQMYGSGSLRNTGNVDVSSTTASSDHEVTQHSQEEHSGPHYEDAQHVADHRERSENTHNSRGYGYGTNPRGHVKPHAQLPPGFHPRIPMTDQDYEEMIDAPSYRNGAPVGGIRVPSGGIYGQGSAGMPRGGLARARGRDGYYGSFDGGYYEVPDRGRINHGLSRGHGISPMGEPDPDSFGNDGKTLIHELEDESDVNSMYASCRHNCVSDQFLCVSTCDCIDLNLRCDESVDCESGEDELECEEIFEARKSNGTCYGERKLLCPESGYCIAQQWLCDGDNDCGDYSDESNCGNKKNCTEDQFECRNGLCVQQSWRCDGENDCRDFSDEENCSEKKKCKEDEYTCPDGSCFLRIYLCDGDNDCDDGSDESKCHGNREVDCDDNHFECSTGRCIRKQYRCDGSDDCGDASDEENCPNLTECSANQFKCENGHCINKAQVCDGQHDCKTGEDEMNCENPTPRGCSPTEEFQCSAGNCISHSWMCDGVPDCSNGEDEEDCPLTCDATQYLCKAPPNPNDTTAAPNRNPHYPLQHVHAFCISKKHLCDGLPDCPLKEDELNCPKKRNCTSSDKCNQQCILTVSNEKACACDPGFALGSDNATCHDVNECEFQKEPVCSQLCNNTFGSFVCGCITGYVLRPDLRTCKAVGGNPSLIFANRIDIRKISLGSTADSKYTLILKGLRNAIAVDYHYEKSLIYWSDVALDVIKRVHVNGSNPEDVIRWGLQSPDGVAIDWIHNLLFWTDSGTRRVEVITLETKIRHVLVSTDLDKPRAIAVHPHYGYVFWTDWGPSPKIERADMDGSGKVALITDAINWPNGLTIDYPTERIFWTDAKHPAIMSAKLDGTDRKKVLSKGLHHPFAITVFEDLIYWTDWRFRSISSANKGNGRGFKTIRSGLHFPMNLHSYHKQRQPTYPNHCGNNNGKCSHMCLPNSTGYSCVCPVGLKIKHDGKNCASTVDNLLIFARKRDLRLIPIDQSTRVFDTVIPVDHVQSAVALTWDAAEEMIYWTDVESGTINKAHLNGTNQSVVITHNLEAPYGLAMDWITKKLYWTDAGTNRIECSNLDGTMRTLLVYEGLNKPRDIVVDPTTGYMYWSDLGEKPKIERAAMDGSRRRVFIGEKIMWPKSLAIDFATRRLYWADGGMKSIDYIDMDGKGKRVRVLSDLSLPFGLTIHQNKMYWTDWDDMSIHRADKDTGGNATVVRSELANLMNVCAFHRYRKTVPNPCKEKNGGCSHLCLLTPDPARFQCACPTGLILEPDSSQKKCRAVPSQFLVFAHRVDIRMISLDVKYKVDVVLPVHFLKNASGVDVDRRTGEVYWTDPGADVITRASFDGKNVQTIVSDGIDTADSLVVDSVGQKLYWTDAGLNSIEVSELDGSNRKVLIWSGLDNPRAIAVHYAKGLLFWTDWGHNARIERANMDGEERATVIADDLVWPNGLSIDTETNRIYWNDAKRKLIEVSDLDGGGRKVLIKSTQHPYGLAVMGNYLYWSDWQTKSIHQADKTTGGDVRIVVNKLEGIMDVRAVTSRDTQGLENACGPNNGGCSHLCLRNPRGYSCACPTGILLKDDKKTCESSPTNFLLFAARKSLARISFDTSEKWEVSLPIPDVHNVYSADFHWSKGLIVYTDIYLRVIRTVSMHNFSKISTIVTEPESTDSSPFKIAVDWLADNVYWTNTKKKVIEVVKIDGSYRKCLLTDLDTPWSIALFPKLGYMFWTEWGHERSIQRALLDGSNRKSIISTDLSYPNGLSIDYEKRKLYWADTVKDRIEVSDLNGNYRIQLVSSAERPYGLSQYGEFIYWAGWEQTSVKRADKASGDSWINIRTSLRGITDVKAVSADRQRGWSPCYVNNGGCSHLCFFVKKNYTCACPDTPDPTCSAVPKERVPIRKPGTENNPDYDEHNENERPPEVFTRPSRGEGDDKFTKYKSNKDKGYTTMSIMIGVAAVITIIILVIIAYLMCQRKPKQEKYAYPNRRNVLTFSNPNYNASSADVGPSNPPTEKKSFIWKKLKYDSSQEIVYEDNGQTSSPEVVSLIPPTATPSSSRAPSVTPRESSPSLIHVSHLNG